MAIELEGLEFQIEAKSNNAAKGVDALAESFGRLKKAVSGKSNLDKTAKSLDSLSKALEGFHTEKMEALAKALESFQNLGDKTISAMWPKRITQLGEALDSIPLSGVEKLEDTVRALENLQSLNLPNRINIPTINQTPQAAPTPANSGTEQATTSTQEFVNAADQAIQRSFTLKSVLSGIGGVFKKGFSTGVGALKSLGNGLVKVGSAAKQAWKYLGALPNAVMSRLIGKIKQTTSSLGQLFSSLKRIAMYRAIRAAIAALTQGFKEGVNNLYQYSLLMGGTFKQSMDSLATSSLYLKNSLAAMAAPIINALAPAIDFLISKLVTLINLLNMVFARLTGKSTYTAAKKLATAYADAADDAAGAAKKAADKIKSYTLGIDELNIIQETPDSGAGGGGGGKTPTDYGSMFEELPIDDGLSDFADRLKELFENEDWEGLGRLLGSKVNEIFDSIDWSGIGHKIGKGLNAAIQTAYYFLDEVNFTNIGKHLAELFNGIVEEVDWYTFGRLLVKGITIIPDLIIGAFMELNWGLISRSFSDLLKGIFDEGTDWLKKYDWKEIGQHLWQSLKDIVTNFDWAGLADSMFTFFGTAIRSAAQFLGGFFGSIAEDIKTWWNNDIKGADWKETGLNLLNAIISGIGNIAEFVGEHIIDPFCNALLGEDVWADIKQAGKDLWDGFCAGVTEFFDDPGKWIKTHIVDPFVKWFKNLFGIHSPSTVMKEIGGYIIEGLLEGILAPFKAIGSWVKENIFDPMKQAFEDNPAIEFAVNVINNAKTWWSNVKTWWAGVSKDGVSLSAFVSLVKSGWTKVATWIGNIPILSQGISLVKSGWTTIKNWIGNIPTLDQAIQLIKSGWTTVKNWIGNIPILSQGIALIKSGWTTVKNWIGNIPTLDQAIQLVKQGWTTVKNWVGNIPTLSQAIALIKEGWTTVKNWIGTIPVLSQGISLIKSGWTTVANWVGNIPVLSQAISLIKSGWSSVSSWIGSLPVISQSISLAKSGWSTISGWIGSHTVSVGVSLFKSGWTSLSSWIGTSISVGVSLFKSGWSSIKSFFGLSSGGRYDTGHGWEFFKRGGFIDNGQAQFWNAIPKYAGGTSNAHGSMFVAGEAGPEMVGHVNGRTEVLNKSQLGQIMHRSIVDGMTQFAGFWQSVNNQMENCTNAVISAMLMSADNLNAGLQTANGYAVQDMGSWIGRMSDQVCDELGREDGTDRLVAGVRDGVSEATARQNDLLREQNELLTRLLNKNTTLQIGNKVIKDAVKTQDKADGYSFTK